MSKMDERGAAAEAEAQPGIWVPLYTGRANANDATAINRGDSQILPAERFEARAAVDSIVEGKKRYAIDVRLRPVGYDLEVAFIADLKRRLRDEFEVALPGIVARAVAGARREYPTA